MKQTSITNFFTSPNLKKHQRIQNENNDNSPIRTRKKKSKNIGNEASSSKAYLQISENEQIFLDAKHFEEQTCSRSEDEDFSQIKKEIKSSKRNKHKKEKLLDKNQSSITKFCSTEVQKDKKNKTKAADCNCTEIKQKSVEEEVAEMKKKWAETDKKIQNLKEILELTRESEQDFYKRKEAERITEQKQVEELEKRKNIEIKNCKHLSLTEIQDLFEQNLDLLIDIKNGTRFCERHKLYNDGTKGLVYNDSCSAFTKEQINKFVVLLHNRFDEGPNPLKFSKYYWGVLLPEITLKIFRDMYNMNEQDALHYLRFMPVSEEDIFDLDNF